MSEAKNTSTNTRKDKVIFTLVIGALIAVFLFTFVILPKMKDAKAAEPAPAPTAEAFPSAPQTVAPIPTPAPTAPKETYTGTDEGFKIDRVDPGFTPTSDRKAQPEDDAAARKVLLDVIPRWGGIDLAGQGIAPDTWAKEIARPGGVSPLFTAWSQTDFYNLWGGVIQMGASAKVLDTKVDKELWNVGSHSMWRVSVTRAIISDNTDKELIRETVQWDILVAQDGDDGPQLAYFTTPDKKNEVADTFYLPPIPRY